MTKRIYTVDELSSLVDPDVFVRVQVDSPRGVFEGVLNDVYVNGEFNILVDLDEDETEEFRLGDCKVFVI